MYDDTLRVTAPAAYVIPQGWWKVIDRLGANSIAMRRLSQDTILDVESYKIDSYQSSPRPFEGHHLNSNVRVSASRKKQAFRKGDYFIPLDGKTSRFLIETLEPQGEDSYFAWNFFDAILGQKEGFSDYVFEETALEILKKDPALANRLKERQAKDSAFAKSGRAQLNFIYQGSPYMEPAFMQYPVYRVLK